MQLNDRKNETTVHLLYVGKDLENLKGFFKAFKESTILNDIRFAGNADEAIKMIFQRDEYGDTLIPNIIITDPASYRTEVRVGILDHLAKRADIKKCIPTVILIHLAEEVEEIKIKNCDYLLISKPNTIKEYQNSVKLIEQFWLNLYQKE